MPFITRRGQRIHYEHAGEGPTVVFQHGLFSRGLNWGLTGYVPRLVADHRVVWVDSLGHGESDKPADAALYSRQERAADLVAVFDALGAEHVHLVGYSMGAWMATGVAIHHPERLASLTLGGWDPIEGPAALARLRGPAELASPDALARLRGHEGFAALLAGVRARLPQLLEWVTPEVEPALRACWSALFELDGVAEALSALPCPALLWSGEADEHYAGARACAEACGLSFLSVPGDHAQAMAAHAGLVVPRLRALFAEDKQVRALAQR
ncbi:MAG: alpha/beta fold hydrolase [Polyangiaceae bacterium]